MIHTNDLYSALLYEKHLSNIITVIHTKTEIYQFPK